MLDISALKAFVTVYETGSFSKSANKLGRTQSAISQQISKLEEITKHPLFIREKNNILTVEGEILLSYARKILALNNEILDRFRQPEMKGEIKIGVPEHFASIYLPEILAEFANSHPNILLNVECDLTLKLLNRFRDNEFDIVLLKMARPEDLPNGFEVWKQKLVWVKNHHQALEFKDDYIPLVLSPKPCVFRTRALEALEEKNMRWRIIYTSPSFSGTVAAVKAGLGVTVLPKNTIPEGLVSIDTSQLPDLMDAHLSLITVKQASKPTLFLAEHIINKLKTRG